MSRHLLAGHHRFQKTYATKERDFLAQLASASQSPGALFIGCSDSRVIPELLTSSAPGELFVIRNVANLVPPLPDADSSVGAAIEYAVTYLKVPHIIVCGHHRCGGVQAALSGREQFTEESSLREWLGGLDSVVERARQESFTGDAAWHWAVEENVLTQLDNLTSFPQVAHRLAQGELQLHGWVYDLATASVAVYDVETESFIKPKS